MKPTNKVLAGAAAGAVASIAAWGTKAFFGVDTPPEIAVAITTVLTFMVQYWVPDTEV